MDYLNVHKEFRHRIILLVGYILVAIALAGTTIVLMYQAYGFGIGKNGTIIQNGLIFLSSQPNPANIYLNGSLNNTQTNARLSLQAGIYNVTLTRTGYNDWRRVIEIDGGRVEHFDYPMLFPKKLVTKKIATYAAAPGVMTQSPDRHWLIVGQPSSMTAFDEYDLQNPTNAPIVITLPNNLLSKSTGSESWKFEDWADDNQHLLLQHIYNGGAKTEYILVDRANPSQSVNLTNTLALGNDQLTLNNVKYDQYYVYDPSSLALSTASLGTPTLVPVLQHVLSYQSYSNNMILYATTSGAQSGQVLIKLLSGSNTYTIRKLPAGTTYLLDLTEYSGELYVAAGGTSLDKVYIYADPIGQLNNQPADSVAVPTQVLRVNSPNYLSFSDNAQFIAVENGQQFGVYDIENEIGHSYITTQQLDAPQLHASWMDGDRLTYVTNGKLLVLDYDDANYDVMMPASSNYIPAFDANYKFAYVLAPDPNTPGNMELTQTSLLTPAGQ